MSPKLSAKFPKRTIALCYIRQSMTMSDSDEPEQPDTNQDVPLSKKKRGPDNDSPERQRANIQALCDRKGWIPKWFIDAEGHKSGRQEKNRPGWLALKTHLDDLDVVAIVANDLSRLHRKGWRVGQLIEWIEEHHLFLALAAPGRELDLSDPRDRLNASFIAMMDEYYAADIAQRMRDSVAHRRSEGKTMGLPPFGTIRDDDGYLKVSPFGAWRLPDGSALAGIAGDTQPCAGAIWKGYHDCAKHILELYSANQHGLNVIAQQVVKEGWAFRSRNGKPRRITRDDVRRVIANWRAYAGLSIAGRSRDMAANLIENAPGVLYDTGRSVFDLELIRAVAEIQTTRSFSTRPFGSVQAAYCYPLTGILYCARCEYRARVEKNPALRAKIGGTNKSNTLHYRHYQGIPCTCHRRSVRTDELETHFLRLVELLAASPEQVSVLVKQGRTDASSVAVASTVSTFEGDATNTLAKTRRRLEAARYLFEDGDLSREEYIKRKELLEREVAHLEAQVSKLAAPDHELISYAESFQHIAESWPVATPEDRQIMIRGLFESVYVDMDTRRIIDFQLKPDADRYLIARYELYVDEGKLTDCSAPNFQESAPDTHFFGWSVLCLEGASGPYLVHHRKSQHSAFFAFSIQSQCRKTLKRRTSLYAKCAIKILLSAIEPVSGSLT